MYGFCITEKSCLQIASVLVFPMNFTSETSSFSKRKPSTFVEYITQIFTNKYGLIIMNSSLETSLMSKDLSITPEALLSITKHAVLPEGNTQNCSPNKGELKTDKQIQGFTWTLSIQWRIPFWVSSPKFT